ncbi:hypothetical protein H6F86_29295 [Phormidium sp. FACHB-592]|uniref:Uncharacterized protein n=1 Tax=Stenomitos frigidus AS-A4 TaxID=2933935 RepID=A0ABV0KQX9_9CYAN|nr:hypothetical protein [Phormidium sp. FACHB-592]MBD2077910.1 hypothetical protein [Phormidium sp. FACHB-592]
MVQAISDREFILQQVVRMLLENTETSSDSNLVLQLALTELVKQVMRELAQEDGEADHLQGKLLQSAVQTTTQLIEARVEAAAQSDLSPSFARLSRSLRWVAKEMTALGLQLRQAQQGEVMRAPKVVSDAPVPFQITELGTRGHLEGLIATPLADCRLQQERVRQSYRVQASRGYPWEVESEGITFVVEADSSIITFLEGFPDAVIEQAKAALEQLAHDLYAPLEVWEKF